MRLDGSSLHYYVSKRDYDTGRQPKGIVIFGAGWTVTRDTKLSRTRLVKLPPNVGSYLFALKPPSTGASHRRVYYLCAESSEALERWSNAFAAKFDELRHRDVKSSNSRHGLMSKFRSSDSTSAVPSARDSIYRLKVERKQRRGEASAAGEPRNFLEAEDLMLARIGASDARTTSLQWKVTYAELGVRIAQQLANNVSLRNLSLRGRGVTNRVCVALGEALKSNTALGYLQLGDSKMGPQGLGAIAVALERNATLTCLDISKTTHHENVFEGTVPLADAMRANVALLRLKITSMGIEDRSASAIGAAVGQGSDTLTLLNLSSNPFGDVGLEALAAGVARSRSLSALLLRNIAPLRSGAGGVGGLHALVESLASRTSAGLPLGRLVLSDNSLSLAHCRALADAISPHPPCASLRTLELDNCSIDDSGARLLARALRGNTSLHELSLRANRFSDLSSWAHAVRRNGTLRRLDLGECPIGGGGGGGAAGKVQHHGVRALGDALAANHALRELLLDGNTMMSQDDVLELALPLAWNVGLDRCAVSRTDPAWSARLAREYAGDDRPLALRLLAKPTKRAAQVVGVMNRAEIPRLIEAPVVDISLLSNVAERNAKARAARQATVGGNESLLMHGDSIACFDDVTGGAELASEELRRIGRSDARPSIRLVSLHGCALTSASTPWRALRRFSHLASLCLARNDLTELPDDDELWRGPLRHLKALDVRWNRLRALPDAVALHLRHCETLLLDHNALGALPNSVFGMHARHSGALRTLGVRDNPATTRDETSSALLVRIAKAAVRTECDLSRRNLRIVPAQLLCCTHLSVLDLSHNALTSIDPHIGALTSLRALNISRNSLQTLPWQLGKLVTLERLDYQSNPFSKIPREVLSMSLANFLAFLRALKTGKEPCNRMKLIVVGDGNVGKTSLLHCLQGMSIASSLSRSSATSSSPASAAATAAAASSSSRHTTANKKKKLSDAAAPSSSKTLLDTATRRSARDSAPDGVAVEVQDHRRLEEKVVIAPDNGDDNESDDDNGDDAAALSAMGGSVSDLFARRSLDASARAPSTIATDGIDVNELRLASGAVGERAADGNAKINFVAYDFAGQSIYYLTHELFMTRRALYVVVFKLTDDFESSLKFVSFWLSSIRTRARDAPVIVVGTYLDDARCTRDFVMGQFDAMTRHFRARHFGNTVCGYFPISARTLLGVDLLRERIVKVALKQPYVAAEVPKLYNDLEAQLGTIGSVRVPPLIALREFGDVARRSGIARSQMRSVLDYLHRVGAVIQFADEATMVRAFDGHDDATDDNSNGDDNNGAMSPSSSSSQQLLVPVGAGDALSTLRQLVILSPQWLANLFRCIITLKRNFVRDGVLDHADLVHIWKEPAYPRSLHPAIVQILIDFDIMHALEHDEAGVVTRSLIPSLTNASPEVRERALVKFVANASAERATTLTRVVSLRFMPSGLFSRFVARVNEVADETLELWRQGMLVRIKRQLVLVVGSPTHVANPVVTIAVCGADPSRVELPLINNLFNLITFWYERLRHALFVGCRCAACQSASTSQPLAAAIARVDEPPSLAELGATMVRIDDIERAAAYGQSTVPCPVNGRPVAVTTLAPAHTMANLSRWIVDADDLHIGKQLGKGAYGVVYLGKFRDRDVAIKQLLGGGGSDRQSAAAASSSSSSSTESVSASTSRSGGEERKNGSDDDDDGEEKEEEDDRVRTFQEFRQEVFIMSKLRHANVVCMLAIALSPLTIVTELCEHGMLFEVLTNDSATIDWRFRLKMALDIAAGMHYLHSCTPPVIHRDLKSANVLCSSVDPRDKVCAKVADFGLSLASTRVAMGRALDNPLWLAVEVMRKRPYTIKCDVYSYGITLWELLVPGETPFSHIDFQFWFQIEEHIMAGARPRVPDTCPRSFRALMERCWHDQPSERPTFARIVEELRCVHRELLPDTLVPTVAIDFEAPRLDASSTSSLNASEHLSATQAVASPFKMALTRARRHSHRRSTKMQ
jgi:serine/threonine protein kinase/Leucine-rich repeat (LRR) protein